MRCIDADELKRRFENHKRLYCKNRIEFLVLSDKDKARVDELDNCIAEILNAPTIEEHKTGKWVRCDTDGFRNMYKCSECGARIDIQEEFRSFFCYHCGADMRGEQDALN